jgi:hypothetical protein
VKYQNWRYYRTYDVTDIWTNETTNVNIFVNGVMCPIPPPQPPVYPTPGPSPGYSIQPINYDDWGDISFPISGPEMHIIPVQPSRVYNYTPPRLSIPPAEKNNRTINTSELTDSYNQTRLNYSQTIAIYTLRGIFLVFFNLTLYSAYLYYKENKRKNGENTKPD